jgi:hypothetical protein
MGEDFAQEFKEIFHCSVKGDDIADARYNAWTALDTAIGNKIPRNLWKLAQMQHDLQIGEDEEGNPIAFVVCEAIWVYNSDDDGGRKSELLFPDDNPSDPDGLKEPEPQLVTDSKKQDRNLVT